MFTLLSLLKSIKSPVVGLGVDAGMLQLILAPPTAVILPISTIVPPVVKPPTVEV